MLNFIRIFLVSMLITLFFFLFGARPKTEITDSTIPNTESKCPVVFKSTEEASWDDSKVKWIYLACDKFITKSDFLTDLDKNPIKLVIKKGLGGADTYPKSREIIFYIGDIDADSGNNPIAYAHFLHESAHIIDYLAGNINRGKDWIDISGWTCDLNKKCTHPCMQTDEKAFYCSYTDHEVLPSRHGSSEYNPRFADVSVNPAEDFAETFRYFYMAPDELKKTSPSRYSFIKSFVEKHTM